MNMTIKQLRDHHHDGFLGEGPSAAFHKLAVDLLDSLSMGEQAGEVVWPKKMQDRADGSHVYGSGYMAALKDASEHLSAQPHPMMLQAGEVVAYRYRSPDIENGWVVFQSHARAKDLPNDNFIVQPLYAQPRPMGVPDGWTLAPIKLPALAVSEIKDMLEIDYGLHNYGARPLWAKLIQIVAGISIDEQDRIHACAAPGKGGEA